jgi:hypothetical protein
MKLADDSRDVAIAPLPASTLNVVRQTNGVLRIHADNGGNLLNLIRTPDGKLFWFHSGFGTESEPVEIPYAKR